MNLALISDLHGNLVALNAVLAHIATQPLDQILCLGDVVVQGPQPRETLARLQESTALMVLGNTDEWTLHPQPYSYRNADTRHVNAVELWDAQQLTAVDRATIASWPTSRTLNLGDGITLHASHGSPRSLGDCILPTTPDTDLTAMLEDMAHSIIVSGHTHVPMLRPFRDTLLINPGSVGYPIQVTAAGRMRHPHWAEYAILNVQNDTFSVTHHRVPYAVAPLIVATRASGMPDVDWWLQFWA